MLEMCDCWSWVCMLCEESCRILADSINIHTAIACFLSIIWACYLNVNSNDTKSCKPGLSQTWSVHKQNTTRDYFIQDNMGVILCKLCSTRYFLNFKQLTFLNRHIISFKKRHQWQLSPCITTCPCMVLVKYGTIV